MMARTAIDMRRAYHPVMSATSSMNISLPSPLRRWVDQVVAKGGYGSASEYFRELVRADQKRRAVEKLESMLLEGLASGPGEEATPEWWAARRAEVIARAKRRKPA